MYLKQNSPSSPSHLAATNPERGRDIIEKAILCGAATSYRLSSCAQLAVSQKHSNS